MNNKAPEQMYKHQHQVQFYETDLMGIVHHSNYLRFYEEARVGWAHDGGLIDYQTPGSAAHFAVLETQVRHVKPARFGDILEISVQARLDKMRIVFEYKMHCPARGGELISEARTTHVPLDDKLQLVRPPAAMKKALEKESWIETWLSNL